MSSLWLYFTFRCLSFLTSSNCSDSTIKCRSCNIVSMQSFLTRMSMFFSAWTKICSFLSVLDPEFVKAPSARRRIGFRTDLVLFIRQYVRRHICRVVHTARNDRLVRVALKKFNLDLHPDPWNEHRAPTVAGPRLDNAKPARTPVVDSCHGGPSETAPLPGHIYR